MKWIPEGDNWILNVTHDLKFTLLNQDDYFILQSNWGSKEIPIATYLYEEAKSLAEIEIRELFKWSPKITEILSNIEHSFVVCFVRDGEKISDFDVIQKVDNFVKTKIHYWEVSNHLVIDYLRVLIKEKVINCDDFTFIVEDSNGAISYFDVDPNGRSSDWVNSQQIFSKFLDRLIQ